jgi:hypothetical protein
VLTSASVSMSACTHLEIKGAINFILFGTMNSRQVSCTTPWTIPRSTMSKSHNEADAILADVVYFLLIGHA